MCYKQRIIHIKIELNDLNAISFHFCTSRACTIALRTSKYVCAANRITMAIEERGREIWSTAVFLVQFTLPQSRKFVRLTSFRFIVSVLAHEYAYIMCGWIFRFENVFEFHLFSLNHMRLHVMRMCVLVLLCFLSFPQTIRFLCVETAFDGVTITLLLLFAFVNVSTASTFPNKLFNNCNNT